MQQADYFNNLRFLGTELIGQLQEHASIHHFPGNTKLVNEGQYITVIPIVLKGLIKVYTSTEEKELLLYYIQPAESCIMSFSSCMNEEKSRINAITEEDCTLLLIPAQKLAEWTRTYPTLNRLFYQQYDLRYNELISTINHLLYDKLDKRLFDYLTEKVNLTGKNPIRISHKETAHDLGTAREVVSRLLKKLEKQGKIKLDNDGVTLL